MATEPPEVMGSQLLRKDGDKFAFQSSSGGGAAIEESSFVTSRS